MCKLVPLKPLLKAKGKSERRSVSFCPLEMNQILWGKRRSTSDFKIAIEHTEVFHQSTKSPLMKVKNCSEQNFTSSFLGLIPAIRHMTDIHHPLLFRRAVTLRLDHICILSFRTDVKRIALPLLACALNPRFRSNLDDFPMSDPWSSALSAHAGDWRLIEENSPATPPEDVKKKKEKKKTGREGRRRKGRTAFTVATTWNRLNTKTHKRGPSQRT